MMIWVSIFHRGDFSDSKAPGTEAESPQGGPGPGPVLPRTCSGWPDVTKGGRRPKKRCADKVETQEVLGTGFPIFCGGFVFERTVEF